jgi:hypothetical protein
MMPWKDQLRLGWRIVRWVWWPETVHAWANAAALVASAALVIAIVAQIWLGALAAFFLGVAICITGRKDRGGGR